MRLYKSVVMRVPIAQLALLISRLVLMVKYAPLRFHFPNNACQELMSLILQLVRTVRVGANAQTEQAASKRLALLQHCINLKQNKLSAYLVRLDMLALIQSQSQPVHQDLLHYLESELAHRVQHPALLQIHFREFILAQVVCILEQKAQCAHSVIMSTLAQQVPDCLIALKVLHILLLV